MQSFSTFHLSRFFSTSQDRTILRFVERFQPKTIVEIGIQQGNRAERMFRIARRYASEYSKIHYLCSDPFESRTRDDGPGLSLREARKKLERSHVQLRCFISPPELGIIPISHCIHTTDLLIVATADSHWIRERIAVLQRILHGSSGIFLGSQKDSNAPFRFEQLDPASFFSRYTISPSEKRAA